MVVLAAVVVPAPAFAAQRQAPYSGLFTGQLNVTPQPQVPAPPPAPQLVPLPPKPANPRSSVVCGMTVAQGDAKIDPKMPRHPPANAPTPAIKIVPAPMCQK